MSDPTPLISLEELQLAARNHAMPLEALRWEVTPIGLHYQQGRQALLAGKHIHFNKTMTTTVAEATELIELAGARGLKIVASPGEVLASAGPPGARESLRASGGGRERPSRLT